MKKILVTVLVVAALMALAVPGAMASWGGRGAGHGCQGAAAQQQYYVDANGDGVCDHRGENGVCGSGRYYVDADGDGVCDHCGGSGSCFGGRYYTDADGDGVCDWAGTCPRYAMGVQESI